MDRGSVWRRTKDRSWRLSRFGATALAAFAIGLVVAGAASAAGVPSQESTSAPGTDLSSPQVHEYARHFGVSEGTAERNLARQSRGAGLTERLEAAQGSAFAGLWFDNQSGEFVLPQLPEAAQAPVESALESAGIGDGAVRTPTVQNSWDELATEQSRLDGRLDMLIQEDVAQTSLEPRTNSVLIVEAASIGSEAKEEVAQIAAAATVAVETRSSNQASFDVSPASCNVAERSCDAPIRGGVYIERTTGAVSCTAGFNATSLQNGSHYVLTAGHCYRAAAAWLARESDGTSQYLGEVEQGVFPGSDYSKIKVANSYWEAGWTSQVTTWGTGETVPITTESASYLGESVCHSGWKSGTSCGVVTALDKTIGYPEGVVYHLTEASGASWCTEPGDSGGPVWGGNTAVGLISGAEKEPACGGHKAYYNEVIEADEAMGVSVGARFTAPFEDSHPVSMRNPTTNQFWIYYRNSDGYLWELYRDPTTGSWANTKVPATEPAAAGSSPVIGRNATTNAQWIYYVGADGYIWELYRNPTTGSWSNTKIPNAQAASPGSSPTNLGDPSAGEAWIYYRGSDGNIWELYRNPINGLWANNKVPAVEPALAGSSPVIGRNSTTNAMWIYYEGVDGHIWELFRNPTVGEWANTRIPNAQTASPGSSPTILGDPSAGQAWIYYRGAEGYIWELYRNPTTGIWANNKVPALEPAAAGTTPVTGRNSTTNAMWIYYQGADGYMWELFRNPTVGEWADTKIPNAEAVAPGTSPTMLGDPSTGEAWIEYWGADGYMWELWRNPSNGIWANGQFPTTAHR